MGRKAKPVDVILLHGKKHLTKEEIKARKEAENRLKVKKNKVKPPAWLDDVAKKEFKRLAKELLEIDLVTNIDVDMLAAYCDAYSQYIECTKIIKQEGLMVEYTNKAAETNKVPHPLLTKKRQLFDQMKAIALEFGFTPSARAKLALPKEEPKEDPIQKMFGDI